MVSSLKSARWERSGPTQFLLTYWTKGSLLRSGNAQTKVVDLAGLERFCTRYGLPDPNIRIRGERLDRIQNALDRSALELLRSAIADSGLSARAFAAEVLVRDERTVRRWLKGDSPIPQVVVDFLADRERALAAEQEAFLESRRIDRARDRAKEGR